MIDTEPKEIIQIEIDHRPNGTTIRYAGSEEGFDLATAAVRSIPKPRDTRADMMVRTIAILATLVGVLYLFHPSFQSGAQQHEIRRDRSLSKQQPSRSLTPVRSF